MFTDIVGYSTLVSNNETLAMSLLDEHNNVLMPLFENFILVRLYCDGGPKHEEYQQMEIDRYGTAALPFYVVIHNKEEEISRFPGMDTNTDNFITFLEKSLIGEK